MELSAVMLKKELWQTLQELRTGKTDPATADSIAAQAREIIRTTQTQLKILNYAKENCTGELIEFAGK